MTPETKIRGNNHGLLGEWSRELAGYVNQASIGQGRGAALRAFFGTDPGTLAVEEKEFPECLDGNAALRALAALVGRAEAGQGPFSVLQQANWSPGFRGGRIAPIRGLTEVAPEKWEWVYTMASFFCEMKEGGQRFVLRVDDHALDGEQELCLFLIMARNRQGVRAAGKLLEDEMEKSRPQNLVAALCSGDDFKFIEREKLCREDLVFPDKVWSEVKANLVDFFVKAGQWERLGLPACRSVLLSGPPGCGKTLLGRWLAATLPVNFIWVPGGRFKEGPFAADSIQAVFSAAQKCAPTLLFIEDIESIGKERGAQWRLAALGELLNQMDGVKANHRLATVFTTNFPEVLDQALINRPGRMDRHVRLALPGPKERQALLGRFLAGTRLAEDGLLEQFVEFTGDFSGAQLRELCDGARLLALEDGLYQEGKLTLHDRHLRASWEGLKASGQRIGF